MVSVYLTSYTQYKAWKSAHNLYGGRYDGKGKIKAILFPNNVKVHFRDLQTSLVKYITVFFY